MHLQFLLTSIILIPFLLGHLKFLYPMIYVVILFCVNSIFTHREFIEFFLRLDFVLFSCLNEIIWQK